LIGFVFDWEVAGWGLVPVDLAHDITVELDYARHAAAARQIAEDFFDSGRVLGGLLERAIQPANAGVLL
jgi:hypothetical protein